MVLFAFKSVLDTIANAQVFEDVQKNHEAYESIGILANLGIIEGVGNNLFLPDSNVRRADFVIMLSRIIRN